MSCKIYIPSMLSVPMYVSASWSSSDSRGRISWGSTPFPLAFKLAFTALYCMYMKNKCHINIVFYKQSFASIFWVVLMTRTWNSEYPLFPFNM